MGWVGGAWKEPALCLGWSGRTSHTCPHSYLSTIDLAVGTVSTPDEDTGFPHLQKGPAAPFTPGPRHKLPGYHDYLPFLLVGGRILRTHSCLSPMCEPVWTQVWFSIAREFSNFLFSLVFWFLFWKAQERGWRGPP